MEFLEGNSSFLAIDESRYTDYKRSAVVIQSLPYENSSSYVEGSVNGPKSIIEASAFVEYYCEQLDIEPYKVGIATQKELDFEEKVDQDAIDLIEQNTKAHLDNGKFVVSLGAEHTVTLGIFKAIHAKYPKVSVLQIDAHSDLRETYEDNQLSHACVMARINEYKPTICQLGIRALSKQEAEYIDTAPNIHTWFAHFMDKHDYLEEVISRLSDDVYITIDTDGFDPSVMPAVGTTEPGGMKWFETLDLLKELCERKNVVGFDIVECAPRENEVQTQYNLAQLAYKLIGYKFAEQLKK